MTLDDAEVRRRMIAYIDAQLATGRREPEDVRLLTERRRLLLAGR